MPNILLLSWVAIIAICNMRVLFIFLFNSFKLLIYFFAFCLSVLWGNFHIGWMSGHMPSFHLASKKKPNSQTKTLTKQTNDGVKLENISFLLNSWLDKNSSRFLLGWESHIITVND